MPGFAGLPANFETWLMAEGVAGVWAISAWALDMFTEDALCTLRRELLRRFGFRNEGVRAWARADGQLWRR